MTNKRFSQKAPKAYADPDFMNSEDARVLRIIAEYMGPYKHFKEEEISNTIVMFGSARIRSMEQFTEEKDHLLAQHERAGDAESEHVNYQLRRLEKQAELSRYYDDATELSRLITEWVKSLPKKKRFAICTGGGPGIMEAANKGAILGGGDSIGLNISLPFEQHPNPYLTPELNFEFHYFFMRKFWFAYLAKALVIMPGGFGTLDELMELLTLIQTRKISKKIPIIIYGEHFWRNVINFDYLVETGMISPEDLLLFRFFDSPQMAFDYLKKELIKIYQL